MMLSPHGELLDVTAHDSPLSRRASDHLPIKARLRFGGFPMAILA
jgi:endonuclease/exonuclease/phosphatase family metal-dependent hydrolase